MKSIHVEYEVEKENAEEARKLISELLYHIRLNETGTIEYRCFYFKSNVGRFFHIMTFEHDEAEEKHRQASYTKGFIENIYRLTGKDPQLKFIEEVR